MNARLPASTPAVAHSTTVRLAKGMDAPALPETVRAVFSRLREEDPASMEVARPLVFARDALLPSPSAIGYGAFGRATVADELALLSRHLELEAPKDRFLNWSTVRVDTRDGALYAVGGRAGQPVTEHALSQFANVLLAGQPAEGRNAALLSTPPAVRAVLLTHLQAVSKRKVDNQVVLRLSRHVVRRGVNLDLRTRVDGTDGYEVRAIVTPRHALQHYDDGVLAGRLARLAPADGRAHIVRGPMGTETRGMVELRDAGDAREVVSFRNSETGEARLGFWGSAYLQVLDAVVTRPGMQAVVQVEAAGDRHERNHTLPTQGTKELAERYGVSSAGTLTETERRRIAEARIDESYRAATESARQLVADWDTAKAALPDNTELETLARLPVEVRTPVLLDWCEEHGFSLGEDRQALERVMLDSTRLQSLPFGSAAYFAGAYALLASRPTVVTGKGKDGKPTTTEVPVAWAESHRLQTQAGRWVTCRWNRKAWALSRGEE